jgi:hypothetical protein
MGEPTYEEVLQFVHQHSRPFVETSEVAEEFDTVSRRTIFDRLQYLHDNWSLEKRNIGGNSVVWWDPHHREASASASLPSSESQ